MDNNQKSARATPALGRIFLIQLAGVYLLDWWFHFEPGDYSLRFWPRIIRGLFALQIFAYTALHARQVTTLRIARIQFLWLGILTLRFLFHGNFDTQVVTYMSAYVYQVCALWVGYCLVRDGHLTTRQVQNAAAFMVVVIALRNELWMYAGLWIGRLGENWSTDNVVWNSAYPLLWFTLMLTLDTKPRLTKLMALLGAIAIVFSMKRGAFLAMILAGVGYGITYAYIHRKNHGLRRVSGIAGILALVIGISIAANANQFVSKWAAASDPNDPAYDAGSGREIFWAIIAVHWLQANPLTKVIGYGPYSTLEITGEQYVAAMPAHDDWLMMLHEFGIIGLLAFVAVCWTMISSVPRLIRNCPDMAPAFVAALSGALIVSIFDLFCDNPETAFFSLLIAVPLGMSARSHATGLEKPALRRIIWRRPLIANQRPAPATFNAARNARSSAN